LHAQIQSFTPRDFRFTCKENAVYVIQMASPVNGEAVVHSIHSLVKDGGVIQSVIVLSSGKARAFKEESDGLHINLPDGLPCKYACVYRIELAAHTQPPTSVSAGQVTKPAAGLQ
jgi:alpha-L-fucosidase